MSLSGVANVDALLEAIETLQSGSRGLLVKSRVIFQDHVERWRVNTKSFVNPAIGWAWAKFAIILLILIFSIQDKSS